MIRKATNADIPAIAGIYEAILDCQDRGECTVGWIRGIYPTADTARAALTRDDLYVLTENDTVLAAAVINQVQVPEYADARWRYSADDGHVLVLHTLTVDPAYTRQGLGRRFVAFYEDTARAMGIRCLRMDTNARNTVARRLYASLGYREADIVPCVFNGIPGVQLVCLEKQLD